MGARYTTERREWWDPVRILLSVVRQPAVWAFLVTPYVTGALGWPEGITEVATGVVTVFVLALTAHYRHWSVAARLRRAMAESGLVGRDGRGRIVLPLARLSTQWVGRNVTLRWRMPPGVTLADVLVGQSSLEARCDCALRCWEEPGSLVMDVLRHQIPDEVSYRTFYSGPRPHGRCLVGLGRGGGGERSGSTWNPALLCWWEA